MKNIWNYWLHYLATSETVLWSVVLCYIFFIRFLLFLKFVFPFLGHILIADGSYSRFTPLSFADTDRAGNVLRCIVGLLDRSTEILWSVFCELNVLLHESWKNTKVSALLLSSCGWVLGNGFFFAHTWVPGNLWSSFLWVLVSSKYLMSNSEVVCYFTEPPSVPLLLLLVFCGFTGFQLMMSW